MTRSLRIALFPAALLAAATAAPAVTIDVPGDQPTIAAAVAVAAEGDEIRLSAGTWTESCVIDADAAPVPTVLAITGAGMWSTVWDAGGAGPCLRVFGAAGLAWELTDLAFTGPGAGAAAAVDVGGAASGSWTVADCRFFGAGPAMLRSSSALTVTGCIFGDAAGVQVTGISLQGADLAVSRCTFDNLHQAATVIGPASASFDRCILSNLATDGLNFGGLVTADCICRYAVAASGGGWPVATNLVTDDPEFCGIVGVRDWSLQSDSPCLDDPVCGLIGARGQGCSIVPDEAVGWGALKAIYR